MVETHRLTCPQFERWFANRSGPLVIMGVRRSAHQWARWLNRQGIDTFLASLTTQRTLYAARRTQASTRLLRADSLVTLYRTLGGDQLIDGDPGKALNR